MKDNLGQYSYVSHALPRFSPLVCPDRPVHVCTTSLHLGASGPPCHLCRGFCGFQSSGFFLSVYRHPSDKPSSFCPGLGPAQGLCWFPVTENGCSLTSCPGQNEIMDHHKYNQIMDHFVLLHIFHSKIYDPVNGRWCF